MKIKKLFDKTYIYAASFIIPFIILAVSYMINGIFPGSEKNIFISDMGGQYIGFFSYLRYIGLGYNNIMYQTLGALGGGYFGTWAYYTSDPLDLIVLLFDPLRLSDAIYFLTLIKISLCGFTFACFLKNGHIRCNRPFIVIISSVSYALMSFNIFYSLNIMWISGSIMLPLVILGVDHILDSKRKELFIISLAVSVIVNYYTAYMIVVFCILYFVYRAVCNHYDMKCFIKRSTELFLSGLLSAALSAWLWLPVLIDLSKGKFSESSNIHYGMVRTPLAILRQYLPMSFDGITVKDAPPLYCGLLVTVLVAGYFFQKRISIRKRLAALAVIAVFGLSLSFNLFDLVWHCFRMPNGFPGRYSFIVSFFLISLFAESIECFISTYFKKNIFILNAVIVIFVFADMMFNSVYGIYSLDNDPITEGYSYNSDYEYFYINSEIYKACGLAYPSRITSGLEYTHIDDFVFAIPSLDFYSSSYNYDISGFFRNLGMNSVLHYTEDSGICPVTATILNVNGAVSYKSDDAYNVMFDLYEPVYSSENFTFYRNQYAGSLGYLYDEDTYTESVSGDVFDNMNHLYHDLAGENVFIRCMREENDTVPIDKSIKYAKEIIVYPEAGMHLFMYVSPDGYYVNEKYCNDYLYLNGNLIAYYSNIPDRYVVDLGYSDGTVLNFTYETDYIDNEVYFYSFDDELFTDSASRLCEKGLNNVVYSCNGIDASVTADKDCNLAVFLPYESGYRIVMDGKPVQYDSYAECVISIPISEGNHDIHISFFTPGLKAGIIISLIGMIVLVILVSLSCKSRRKVNI